MAATSRSDARRLVSVLAAVALGSCGASTRDLVRDGRLAEACTLLTDALLETPRADRARLADDAERLDRVLLDATDVRVSIEPISTRMIADELGGEPAGDELRLLVRARVGALPRGTRVLLAQITTDATRGCRLGFEHSVSEHEVAAMLPGPVLELPPLPTFEPGSPPVRFDGSSHASLGELAVGLLHGRLPAAGARESAAAFRDRVRRFEAEEEARRRAFEEETQRVEEERARLGEEHGVAVADRLSYIQAAIDGWRARCSWTDRVSANGETVELREGDSCDWIARQTRAEAAVAERLVRGRLGISLAFLLPDCVWWRTALVAIHSPDEDWAAALVRTGPMIGAALGGDPRSVGELPTAPIELRGWRYVY